MGFPRGRCRELLESHGVPSKKSYAVFVRAPVLPRGCVTWASIEENHIKRRSCSSTHLSAVQNQGGADQANWMPCRCPRGPRAFSSSWISAKASWLIPQTDSWPSPLPPHIGTQAPQVEPSALISCAICWWVHSQPLQTAQGFCPEWDQCWWFHVWGMSANMHRAAMMRSQSGA